MREERASEQRRNEANATTTDRVPDAVFAFVEWFVKVGVEAGVVPAHLGLDPALTARRTPPGPAEELLRVYGRAECETRSRRLLGAKAAGSIKREFSVATLLACWGWEQLAPPPVVVAPPAGAPSKHPANYDKPPERAEFTPEQLAENREKLRAIIARAPLPHVVTS